MTRSGVCGFAWVVGGGEQPGQAFFPKLPQPAAEGTIGEPERIGLCFGRSLPSQAGSDRMVPLLSFVSDGHIIKS